MASSGLEYKFIIVLLVTTLSGYKSFSQVEIPVDMYTGSPSISIPIGTISAGDINESVGLSYNVNTARQESPFGAGWSLEAGGSISREVRSFPDDIGYQTTTQGWLYNNASSVSIALDIKNFTPGTETADFQKLNGFNYLVDTEPDIFNYSFGGVSGSFVIDNGLAIRTMPYHDVKIVMDYGNSSDKRILGFTITTNTGYVYTFDYKISVTKASLQSVYANRDFYIPTEYELYNPSVTYTREWKLSRIDSPNGNYMTFSYQSFSSNNGIRDIGIGLYQYPDPVYQNPSDIITPTVYQINEWIGRAYLSNITASSGEKIDFNYNGTLKTVKISDDRRGVTASERLVKNFEMTYQPVFYYIVASGGGVETISTGQFLKTLTESSGCEIMPPYKFDYTGIKKLNYYQGDYLPAAAGYGVDLWGNPNGATYNKHLFPKLYIYPAEPAAERYRTSPIPNYVGQEVILEGANRNSSSSTARLGALYTITSPEGGVTTFSFEGNQYLDTRTNLNASAGGLRIQSISYFDGISPVTVSKTFEYVDPATGLSSGRLIRKPNYAMPAYKWKSPSGSSFDKTFQTSGLSSDDKWKYLTIRTTEDLTQSETTHGSPVGYKVVTVKRPGAGSSRHEYYLPAIHGENSSGEWLATSNKYARYSTSISMGIVTVGETWMFPYTTNPNFDYQRGLPWKKTEFNEAGTRVKETITTYQNVYKSASTPFKVWGLKYDRYAGSDNANKIFLYGKYFLLTEAQRVPSVETVTSFDIVGGTQLTETTEYIYGSSTHKLLTDIKHTTADGDVLTTSIKYPMDYTTYSTGAVDALAIHSNKSNNRHGIPIETIQKLKKSGSSTTWVTGGTVVKLDPMGHSIPMLKSTWELINTPINLIDFFNSSIVNESGYKFKVDPNYKQTSEIVSYTSLGLVKESRNTISRQTTSVGYGHNTTLPIVHLMNASSVEAAFSDFDNTTGFEFSSATPYYGKGRTGAKGFYPWVMLYKTITKAAVNNYVVSFWVKSNASQTFTISLKNTAGTTTYYSTSITVPSTGSAYQYVQRIIPITAVTASTFKVEIQGSGLSAPPSGNPSPGGTSSTLLPIIDDVFFYPENAEMIATSYNIPFGSTSTTSGSGQASFTEYDKLGRLRFVYDREGNIVKRNIYQYNQETPLVADFSIPYPFTITTGIATTFTASTNDCVTDATYQWDWGSGYVSGTSAQSHTFSTPGTYVVGLKVTSATYGTKSTTKTFTVTNSPFEIDICAKGTIYYSGNIPDLIAACTTITTTPSTNQTIFRVTHQVSGIITYQWKTKDFGSSTWVDVGGNSNEYIFTKTGTNNTSFAVMCQVTSSSSGIGNSPSLEMIFQP